MNPDEMPQDPSTLQRGVIMVERNIRTTDKRNGLTLADLARVVQASFEAGCDPTRSRVTVQAGWRGQAIRVSIEGVKVE